MLCDSPFDLIIITSLGKLFQENLFRMNNNTCDSDEADLSEGFFLSFLSFSSFLGSHRYGFLIFGSSELRKVDNWSEIFFKRSSTYESLPKLLILQILWLNMHYKIHNTIHVIIYCFFSLVQILYDI